MRWPRPIDAPLQTDAHLSEPQGFRGQLLTWLVAGLTLFSACAVAAALVYLRNEALRTGEILSESLLLSVSGQTSRAFQATDLRLQIAASQLESLKATQGLNQDSARAVLREQLQGLPFVQAISVVDQQGQIIFDSDVGNIGRQQADREYFQVYQQQPAAGFHLSAPLPGSQAGTWLISASRPLRSANGELRGVIEASIDLAYFDQLWGEIRLAASGSINLFRRDGMLMMRSPMIDASMGKALPNLLLFSRYLPKAPKGSFLASGALDKRVRLISYQQLAAYPDLVMSLGRTESEVLGPWNRFAVLVTSIWLAAIAMLIFLSLLLQRQTRHTHHTAQRFYALAQAMPQIVYIADAGRKLTFISRQWTDITGQPVEAALAGGWLRQVHPDDRAKVLADAQKTLATGSSSRNEHRLLCRDGIYRWYLARSTPIRDKQGKITAWYSTSTDIDELQQSVVALKTQTDLARIADHLAKVGGWTLNAATTEVILSKEASLMLGQQDPSLSLAKGVGLFLPESSERINSAVHRCMSEGISFDERLELLTADGERRWIRSIGQAQRDENGKITFLHGAIQDFTAEKLAAEALSESEQDLAALFDAAPVPMWVMDKTTHQNMAANDTAIRNYGFSRTEFLSMTPIELRPASEQVRMRQMINSGLVMNTPEPWIHQRKDGSKFPVVLVRREIRHGGTDAVIAAAFDISQQVNAKQKLQAQLQSLQRTSVAAQVITRQNTLDEVIQTVADQARIVIGAHQAVVSLPVDQDWAQTITASSLSEKYETSWQLTDKPDGSGIDALVCETNQAMRLTQAELQAHPRWRGFGASAERYSSLRGWLAVPLIGSDGKNRGLLQLSDKNSGEFSQQDEYVATELAALASIAIANVRLLAEVKSLNSELEEKVVLRTHELKRQENLFRTLAEQAPQPIWTMDPQGAANFISQAWYDLVGGKTPDWHGHAWTEVVYPEDLVAMTAQWHAHKKNCTPYQGIRRLRSRDGHYHTMSYRVSPVFDEDGEVNFWVGIDMDITELKAVEAALRLSNAELEAFSYSVSHDLRSPLSAVDGFCHLLARQLNDEAGSKRRHYLNRIQSGISQMGQLIEGLLSLAHVARLELHDDAINLSKLAAEIMARLQAEAPARQLACTVQPGLQTQGDKTLIQALMENLLGNAWKFSGRKERSEIEVGFSPAQQAFFVRDNGAGFDMAYVDKLFGTFQRLHSPSEFSGTGIGLATVHRIVTRHGGRIWAESAPDQGATFYFTLADTEISGPPLLQQSLERSAGSA
jgi:PAS domain S-box-containing protein